MARKQKTNRTAPIASKIEKPIENNPPKIHIDSFWKFLFGSRAEWLLFALASILYIQTVTYEYTMDDAIVITDNMFTTQGIKGIPGIYKYDTFYGFFKEAGKEQLVSGGRYRPFTLSMFAIERSLFGDKPFFSHLINVLLFAITCVLLFRILKYLFASFFSPMTTLSIAFIAALLFATHPIHSEVVANIKGRDEIMSLLGCLIAFWYGMKWADTNKISYLVIALIAYFAALLSKENAVSLLAWFPAAMYIFKKKNIGQSLLKVIPFFSVFILFFLIRSMVLKGSGFSGSLSGELLNNPFLKWENNSMVPLTMSEKLSTIFYCLGMYLKLLIFPHPLTHDYYPRQIPILPFTNIGVLFSLLLNIFLFITSIWLILKRKILGFAGLLYFIPLLIISNLFFPIGTHMGERFIYISSLGFCIAIALLFHHLIKNKKESKIPIYLTAAIALLFSIKTIARNPAWKSNLTLFETDIKTSTNSAKLNNSIGSEYIKIGGNSTDLKEKNILIENGIKYLEKAISIHPLLINAYLNLGNAQVYLDKPEIAINYYNTALAIDSSFKNARTNIAVAYRMVGRQAGEIEHNIEKTYASLTKSLYFNPDDIETIRLMGIAHGIRGEHELAIECLTKVLNTDKENAQANYNLGLAIKSSGNIELGNQYIEKAKQLNPSLFQGK